MGILKSHLGIVQKGRYRHIAIDRKDEKSIRSTMSMLQSLLDELLGLEPKTATWDKCRVQFDLIEKIWQTDISYLFSDLDLCDDKSYYVYAHLDSSSRLRPRSRAVDAFSQIHLEIPNRPFYIGKGRGNRYMSFERNETYRKRRQIIETSGFYVHPVIIKNGLTECEALCYESKLIDIFGFAMFGGLLTNLDEGYKPEIRRKMYPHECLSYFPKEISQKLLT